MLERGPLDGQRQDDSVFGVGGCLGFRGQYRRGLACLVSGMEGMEGIQSFRELIDYRTSMITDEDPLRGLLFY